MPVDLMGVSVLLVEDEEELRRETAGFLEFFCGRVVTAAHGREALEVFGKHVPDVVVTDIRMPVMDGMELATRLKDLSPETPVIICTAYSETEHLLKAIELGISAFVRKPVDTDQLLYAIAGAVKPLLQRREIARLASELAASVGVMLGSGPAMQSLADQAARIARSSFAVLLHGETGTGKSRLAGIIHDLGSRRTRPFVTVHLGMLPEHLTESELFGHERGAFTGADRKRTGLMEAAHGGTIFLDDIDAAPPAVQAKLLRVVEEKKFFPVGSATVREVDVRIIAASNRDLREEVAAGRFREDLYYRLADLFIQLPPLRIMPEEIAPLVRRFVRETAEEMGIDPPDLDADAMAKLAGLEWPGNIRELKSVVRRLMLLGFSRIGAAQIGAVTGAAERVAPPLREVIPAVTVAVPFPGPFSDLEKWALEQALALCDGRAYTAAKLLDMNYYKLRRRLERHGIAPKTED